MLCMVFSSVMCICWLLCLFVRIMHAAHNVKYFVWLMYVCVCVYIYIYSVYSIKAKYKILEASKEIGSV